MSYVVLFFWCIIDTYKNRKVLEEIIENGRCVNAKVKRLIKESHGKRRNFQRKFSQLMTDPLLNSMFLDKVF